MDFKMTFVVNAVCVGVRWWVSRWLAGEELYERGVTLFFLAPELWAVFAVLRGGMGEGEARSTKNICRLDIRTSPA